jgi:hypothetical protein
MSFPDDNFPLPSPEEIEATLIKLHAWERLEEFRRMIRKDETMSNDTYWDDKQGAWMPRKVVPSTTVAIPEDVTVLGNGVRAGNADRDRAINHITQMADLGYVSQEEAERRIRAAENIERHADLRHITSDLPAPVVNPGLVGRYNWDSPKCWIPTLITGMAASGITAILPASILSVDHLFPGNGIGLAVGILTLIVGVLAFFGCLAGIIVKANEN